MKNYYEILEISKNASSEIIEKAYKTLAKKYHPDVQEEDKKEAAEVKFKEIGEAYDILSDAEKKLEYDIKYEKFISASKAKATQEAHKREQETQAQYQTQNSANENHTNVNDNIETEYEYQEEANTVNSQGQTNVVTKEDVIASEVAQKFEAAISKAYNDAYMQRLRDYGYKIKYRKSFKDKFKNFLALVLTVLVLIVILFILWQIGPIRERLIALYNENPFISAIVDIFIK